jgi:hypothetical protein
VKVDPYRDGWLAEISEDGIKWEQYQRLKAKSGKRGSDVVGFDCACPTCGNDVWIEPRAAEIVVLAKEVNRIQAQRFKNDPPRARALLLPQSYLEEINGDRDTRAEIGREGGFIQAVWDRVRAF